MANDKIALSATERTEATADLERDLLELYRVEAALVWRGLEQKLPVQHSRQCHPLAILSAQLVTQPAGPAWGTSPEHSYAIVGATR